MLTSDICILLYLTILHKWVR